MLTLDTVRAALLSEQPWPKIDALVRAELSNGHTTRQIYSSLMALANEVDATPGLSEDGFDAFGDVLDALTGYCRPECQYKDPPNVKLPTEEEIAKLPRWARVAFAARCARRVLPLFPIKWPIARADEFARITSVVEFTERAAATGHAFVEAAKAAGHAAANIALIASVAQSLPAQAIARCAARGAQTIVNAGEYALPGSESEAVSEAVQFAIEAATAIRVSQAAGGGGDHETESTADSDQAILITRCDFDHLSRFAEAQRWDDNTPIPPEVFGPLWPEGAPKGWPASDVPLRPELVIEGFVREQAAHRVIVDDVVNLFNVLNRYYIVRSGSRLTLDQFNSLLPALVPAEV
ncbi:hypothetical protein R5W23_002784 [Gemmata sp. JC673]|uniref:Uncharacterized protein n=1 Tax=Gemmata algarum TaxID=2975278 RepID=A0ABU5F6K9_9BACT|nr:hypothetical protein [Gemmata algarum]MDY3561506.1 hypothetical protein [Gemmata algarum]